MTGRPRKSVNGNNERRCSICKRWLPFSCYYKNSNNWSGLTSKCRECTKIQSYRSGPRRRAEELKRRYGITWEEYVARLQGQDSKCAICRRDIVAWGGGSAKGNCAHVDHDHGTNTVRGILCNACNAGLGQFRDNIYLMARAMEYLSKHQEALS